MLILLQLLQGKTFIHPETPKIRWFAFCLLVGFTIFHAHGQSGTITGMVIDTLSYPKVQNATVMIIGSQDSLLRAYTRTKGDGVFTINNVAFGEYILLVSHPNFGDYAEEFQLNENQPVFEREVLLTQKSVLLNELIVQQQRLIKLKGDTIEFSAESYKLTENATVEDLLKVLPGVQVDKSGKITAYGETVNKVYVDGEEFFGDDPTVATRNLTAEMIDKVQIFDKKSDQTQFTGVDDGEKNKVINLTLKPEFKKGYFGKAQAGAGLPNTSDNAMMINAFDNNRKASGYLLQSNIGNNSLDWDDRMNYGGDGFSMSVGEGGDVSYSYSYEGQDYNTGQGITNSIAGGANYSDKFFKNKLALNSSYQRNQSLKRLNEVSGSQYQVNDSGFFLNNTSASRIKKISHNPSAKIAYEIDSFNTLSIKINYKRQNGVTHSEKRSEILKDNFEFVNNNSISVEENSILNEFAPSLHYGHRFRKKRRSLSISSDFSYSQSLNEKFNNSEQNYFTNNLLSRSDTFNQRIEKNLENRNLSASARYTEPISKNWTAVASFRPNFSFNNSQVGTFNNTGFGKYDNRVDTLSNNFDFNTIKQIGGIGLNYNKKDTRLWLTLNIEKGKLQRLDKITNQPFNFSYTALNPSANYDFKLKNNISISLRYSGSNRQPGLNQQQPVKDYSNPLLIYLGNPNLKPEYNHNFNLNVRRYWLQHGQWLYGNFTYNLNQRSLIQNTVFDEQGRRLVSYSNGGNTNSYNTYLRVSRDFADELLSISLNERVGGSQTQSIINTVLNQSSNTSNSIGLEIDLHLEEVFFVSLSYDYQLTLNKNQATTLTSSKVSGHSVSADGEVSFLKHCFAKANYNFTYNTSNKTVGVPFSIHMLDATTGYKFLKNQLQASIIGYNLLNQNNGFDISQSANSITRSQHNVLGRYFMASLVWRFASKNSGKTFDDDEDY